jgi:hypothetical protein
MLPKCSFSAAEEAPRLKRFFSRLAPVLLALSVLTPTLASFGFYQR